jgi:hypothetical protein
MTTTSGRRPKFATVANDGEERDVIDISKLKPNEGK